MAATSKKVEVDGGINVFYREAGNKENSTLLLLHGFPTSSFQFRNLIPLLATKYHVVAPDLPGFGFTEVPDSLNYKYTFDNLADTIESFTKKVGLTKYAIYIFDYGSPVGLRLALRNPKAITAIITQNGNCFEDGLSSFWEPLRKLWAEPNAENREALRGLLNLETTKFQYHHGEANPHEVDPETYTLDQVFLDRPGNQEIQLDLFHDYGNNVKLYPTIHEYLSTHKPPVLAVWGKNDPIFIPPGAEAFKKLLPEKTEVHLIDGGHFPLENHVDEIHGHISTFLAKNGI